MFITAPRSNILPSSPDAHQGCVLFYYLYQQVRENMANDGFHQSRIVKHVGRWKIARVPCKNKSSAALKTMLLGRAPTRGLAEVTNTKSPRNRRRWILSNFDKESAATPFERRKYSEAFQDRLYNWKPPID